MGPSDVEGRTSEEVHENAQYERGWHVDVLLVFEQPGDFTGSRAAAVIWLQVAWQCACVGDAALVVADSLSPCMLAAPLGQRSLTMAETSPCSGSWRGQVQFPASQAFPAWYPLCVPCHDTVMPPDLAVFSFERKR